MNARAIAVTSHEHVELVDVQEPASPAPGQIAGRTLCTLMSPGTEIAANYRGSRFPSYPGYAAVFEVEQVAHGVEGFAPGDIAFCMGSHRSRQTAPSAQAARVPPGLAPEHATIARLMCVTMTTLVTTAARPGDTVVVSGAGPIGYLGACMFVACGYRVLVVEPDDARRACAARSGPESTYPRMPLDDPDVAGNVALVVECSGHEQAMLDACRVVRKRGEVVLVGVPWARQTDITAHEILSEVFHRYVVLRSGWEWELDRAASDFHPHSIWGNVETALRWLAEERIPLGGLLETTAPSDAQVAYQRALHRKPSGGLFTVFDWRR